MGDLTLNNTKHDSKREACKSDKYTYKNYHVKLDVKRSRPMRGLTVSVPIVQPTEMEDRKLGQSSLHSNSFNNAPTPTY